ncbi:MAG: hypothetical protein IT204_09420 [Fimbriimonadaceae bacterium]|nr:hypothetical protein [Fimbriimonadaceae bacterium]
MRRWLGACGGLVALGCSLHLGRAAAPVELRFEAEVVSTPADGWLRDQDRPDKWCLWTTEPEAAKKRSGAQTLKTPVVVEDRARPEDGAPVLRAHCTGIPAGQWDVELPAVVRLLAISLDGRTWRPYRGGPLARGLRIDQGTFDLWVDDRYAWPDHPGPAYFDCVILRRVGD